ncbi:cytochrome P450 [Lentinula aciculospora]|uniref:Cytochrome P450 n=1 Tax=Lentinula aciculospora TaxID=153920 RepID=A0A9W9DXC9_9AGAR|nr:cytochrome P450 [Lentinula aciculospora]
MGPANIFVSYMSARRYLSDSMRIVQEGYHQHRGHIFKVAEMDRWTVFASGPQLVKEVMKAPDSLMNGEAAAKDLFQAEWTFGGDIVADPYHINYIRTHLTHNLSELFPDMFDEVKTVLAEKLPTDTNKWVPIQAADVFTYTINRMLNRVFVGLPLCRNEEYLALMRVFATDVIQDAAVIRLFPKFMKPAASIFLTKIRSTLKDALKYLGPMIDERREVIKYADSDSKCMTLIDWFLAQGVETDTKKLAMRVAFVNFVSLGTTSMSFMNVLFDLCAAPQFAVPLRQEVQTIVGREGWSKTALQKCLKLDSLLKESVRLSIGGGFRKVTQDHTFSDGTFVPKGNFVNCPARAMHKDPEIYGENAEQFDPFRWSVLREQEGQKTKHQHTATSPAYIPFGHGTHACPGRFFASMELKILMAYLLMNYEFRFPDGKRPPEELLGDVNIPNTKAIVHIRRRQLENI